jgi:WD repeat-containing protein 19
MEVINKKLIFAYREDKLGMSEVIFCWQPGCKWLAFCGETRVIVIVDRLGKKMVEFQLKFGGKVKHMEFDSEGDTLAIIQEACSIVTIINVYTKKTLDIDIDKNNKDRPTCIRWGKNHPTLGIGTDRGMIYYYNKKSDKIYPVSMNHTKAVCSADWNDEGNLATGDENKSLSVTNRMGEPVLQNASLKADPKMIRWARQKTNDSKSSYTTISTVLSNKTILIYDIKKKSNPIELALDSDYGNIVTYQWFGDGYIAIGFTKGFISIISTHMTEIKNEVHSMQVFKSGLDDFCVCEEVNRIAIAGENSVKIFDTNSWLEIADEKIEISNQAGRISKIQWSNTGQILIVSTYLGSIFAFNVIVNDSYSSYKNMFSCLWSLNEVATFEVNKERTEKCHTISLLEEPKTFTLSANYFIANYGTKLQIFKTGDSRSAKSKYENSNLSNTIKDFQSMVNMMATNREYMAVLSEGRVHFICIETDSIQKIFPLKDTDDQILFVTLTDHFLVYSDSNGKVKIFSISENCANISDYKFENPIKKIFPNTKGTKFVCIDNMNKGFLYNPVIETCHNLNNELEIQSVIWDYSDENIFVTITAGNILNTYLYVDSCLEGAKVQLLRDNAYLEDLEKKMNPYNQKLEAGVFPFYLNKGYIYYFVKNTKEIKGVFLQSHFWIYNWRDQGENEDGHKKYFIQNLQLGQYWNCMKVADFITENKEQYLEILGKSALKSLNIDVAEEAFRRAKNVSLTLTVEKLRLDSEKKILLGHIAAILGEDNLAIDLFKESSQPKLSLDLRVDLQDWNSALKLASQYAPHREPFISRRLAYQNETNGRFPEAVKLYEKSLIINIKEFFLSCDEEDAISKEEITDHNLQCYAGISRCSFRLGDTTRGLSLAVDITDKNMTVEIASLCEHLSYNLEAARLYTGIGLFEKAATIYISLKHFKSAEDLIDKIKSPKLLIALAKMKEADKLYQDAEKAYQSASDWENVIRINLKFLENPSKAYSIMMNKFKNEQSALMMSEYYESKGKKKETIEFKLIAKRYEEAFAIAQSYNEMDAYADYIFNNEKSYDEFKKIAIYYEGKNLYGKSGVFYEKSGAHEKALKMYIKGMNDEYLERAVRMVGNYKQDSLVNELIDHLLGNNMDNSAHYLTRLYVLLGKFKEACEIAINLATQEQDLSNYKNAHDIILDLYKELKERSLPVSFDLNHKLSVLHSYTLAKKMIVTKQHMKAARNLLKVANNISMFEKDASKILTTVVIECSESGLNKSASNFAINLMSDNYRHLIPEAYKGRIEKISRKAYKMDEEPHQTTSPCPFCSYDVYDYNLDCRNCNNIIPFCIASGRHLTKDITQCPSCKFPGIMSEFTSYLTSSQDKTCPMCDEGVDYQLLEKVLDIQNYLKSRKIANMESIEKPSNDNYTIN